MTHLSDDKTVAKMGHPLVVVLSDVGHPSHQLTSFHHRTQVVAGGMKWLFEESNWGHDPAAVLVIFAGHRGLARFSTLAEARWPFTKGLPGTEGCTGCRLRDSPGGGAFESITDIPNGWHVAFENDPSWKASFDAHAKPGAAALDEKALRSIWLQITRNEVGDTQFNVWGSLTVASNLGVEKEVPLSSFSFDFIERYSRHRLF